MAAKTVPIREIANKLREFEALAVSRGTTTYGYPIPSAVANSTTVFTDFEFRMLGHPERMPLTTTTSFKNVIVDFVHKYSTELGSTDQTEPHVRTAYNEDQTTPLEHPSWILKMIDEIAAYAKTVAGTREGDILEARMRSLELAINDSTDFYYVLNYIDQRVRPYITWLIDNPVNPERGKKEDTSSHYYNAAMSERFALTKARPNDNSQIYSFVYDSTTYRKGDKGKETLMIHKYDRKQVKLRANLALNPGDKYKTIQSVSKNKPIDEKDFPLYDAIPAPGGTGMTLFKSSCLKCVPVESMRLFKAGGKPVMKPVDITELNLHEIWPRGSLISSSFATIGISFHSKGCSMYCKARTMSILRCTEQTGGAFEASASDDFESMFSQMSFPSARMNVASEASTSSTSPAVTPVFGREEVFDDDDQ